MTALLPSLCLMGLVIAAWIVLAVALYRAATQPTTPKEPTP